MFLMGKKRKNLKTIWKKYKKCMKSVWKQYEKCMKNVWKVYEWSINTIWKMYLSFYYKYYKLISRYFSWVKNENNLNEMWIISENIWIKYE